MSKLKKKDFECTDEQINLLKAWIKQWHEHNNAFAVLPYSAKLTEYWLVLNGRSDAMKKVQTAFWWCTKSYNSSDHCALVTDIKFFESFVDSYEKAK